MPNRRSAREPPAVGELDPPSVRLDKWLWAARFWKTRSLAADEIARGRVVVGGLVAKASREVRVGDRIELRQGTLQRRLTVTAVSAARGSAAVAAGLYAEDESSVREREASREARRLEPAAPAGRPGKRDRRRLADWQRWSAAIADE